MLFSKIQKASIGMGIVLMVLVQAPGLFAQNLAFEHNLGPEWSQVGELARDSSGHLYLYDTRGSLFVRPKGETNSWSKLPFNHDFVSELAAAGSGHVFAATSDGLYRVGIDSSVSHVALRDTVVHDLAIENDSSLWLATEAGLYHYSAMTGSSTLRSTPVTSVTTADFHGDSTLAIGGQGDVYLSLDRGKQWTRIFNNLGADSQFDDNPTDILVRDPNTIFVSLGYRGYDQGIWVLDGESNNTTKHRLKEYWVEELIEGKGGSVLSAVQGSCGSINCSDGGVYRSVDSGGSWEQWIATNRPTTALTWDRSDNLWVGTRSTNTTVAGNMAGGGVVRADGSTGFLEPVNNGLVPQKMSAKYSNFAVVNSSTWLANIPGVGMVKTDDEGASWTYEDIPSRDSVAATGLNHEGFISSIDVENDITFISQYEGRLHRSLETDTGRVEELVHIPQLESDKKRRSQTGFGEIEHLTGSIYFAMGGGDYYESDNRGVHWQQVDEVSRSGYQQGSDEVIAADTTRNWVYVVDDTADGGNGTVKVSRDSGATWQNAGSIDSVASIATNEKGDFVAYGYNEIYIKPEGMREWSQVEIDLQSDLTELHDVAITDDGVLIAGTSDGLRLKMSRSSEWKTVPGFESLAVSRVMLDSDDYLYALTENGLARSSERVVNSIARGESDHPDKYVLGKNYPNPFNPSTQIQFRLPRSAEVKLTIYNSVGQQVARLVDRTMTAGTHSVQFDGSGLSSGMYIYRLKSADFVDSSKMMLIK